jgi:hypothetical protein
MRANEIIESLDSDVESRLVRATNDLFTTEAIINNRKIIFNASKFSEILNGVEQEPWEIEFTEKSSAIGPTYGKSGNGGELQVFSFVIESMKELAARYSPDAMVFTSHKADGNRTSLYKRIGSRISIPGYHLADVEDVGPSDHFRIVRDQ